MEKSGNLQKVGRVGQRKLIGAAPRALAMKGGTFIAAGALDVVIPPNDVIFLLALTPFSLANIAGSTRADPTSAS